MRDFFAKTMKTGRLREDKKLCIRLLVSIGKRRNDRTRRASGRRPVRPEHVQLIKRQNHVTVVAHYERLAKV